MKIEMLKDSVTFLKFFLGYSEFSGWASEFRAEQVNFLSSNAFG